MTRWPQFLHAGYLRCGHRVHERPPVRRAVALRGPAILGLALPQSLADERAGPAASKRRDRRRQQLGAGWSYLPDKLVLSNAADVIAQVHAVAVKPRLPSLSLAYLDLASYILLALILGTWRTTHDA